jgi:hypothetical protein
MRISQLVTLAAVIGVLACSQLGCASAKSVGEEKSSPFQGTQTMVAADPVAVTNAAKSVAEELQLTVVTSGASGLDGKMIARTANNRKLTIDVKSAGESLSRVTIRAGGFGDREIQKQVLDRIRAKLPAAPEGVAPSGVAKVTVTYPNGTSPTGTTPARSQPAPAQTLTPAPAPSAEAHPDTAQLPF